PAEARAAYEKLAREFPGSLRRREAVLREAQLLMQSGQAAAVPAALDQLQPKGEATTIDGDDAAALLLRAKACEQTGNSSSALTAYRRIYFFAPASAEAAEASSSLTRMGSSSSPANVEEATTRAERLFAGKRFADAYDAFTTALTSFPTS